MVLDWRTALAIGAQATFVWAAIDPEAFKTTMLAVSLTPRPLWIIWGGIFAFYFIGKIIESLRVPMDGRTGTGTQEEQRSD